MSNQVLGGVELLDIITVTGDPVQSVAFGAAGDGAKGRALDGDADGEYLLVSKIKNENSGTLTRFDLRPNGLTTNQRTQRSDIGWFGSTSRVTWLEIAYTLTEWSYANTELHASTAPGYRTMLGECVVSDEDLTDYKQILAGGIWADDSTNITSLEIYCTTGVFIGAGSEFHLYRRGLWI